MLELGNRKVELRHFKAHTRGDTVIILADISVMITGDMLDALPYAGHGYFADWVSALNELRTMAPEIIVPGHGPVFEGTDQLELVRDFIATLLTQSTKAVEAGKDLEATRAVIDVSEFRQRFANGEPGAERFFDAVLGEAIERAWSEANGVASEG